MPLIIMYNVEKHFDVVEEHFDVVESVEGE